MSHIWKCGFCNETHTKHGKMRIHESKCPSNPENKLCFSCNNHFHGLKTCSRNINTFNVYTSGVPCNHWSQRQTNVM